MDFTTAVTGKVSTILLIDRSSLVFFNKIRGVPVPSDWCHSCDQLVRMTAFERTT